MAGRSFSLGRRVALAAAALLGLGVLAEISLRVIAGERLLYHADAEIEYLPQPDQWVVKQGIEFRTNAWGMRSDDVPEVKPADSFRVLVLGDSVLFGHTNISHDDLATTQLSRMRMADGRRIEALNASATSWGPGNMVAWLDRFGALDSDAIIILLSTHDLEDDRTFKPPRRDPHPVSAPSSALADWLLRKLTPDPAYQGPEDPRSAGDAMTALPILMQRAAAAPMGGCLVIQPTRQEWQTAAPVPEQQRLEASALGAGLAVLYARAFFDEVSAFADDTHLSPAGQQDLARAFAACPALARMTVAN